MANQKSISAFFFLILAVESLNAAEIAVYWGQNGFEGSLAEACATSYYEYVIIAFLDRFGKAQTPHLNLDGHCNPSSPGSCSYLSDEIKGCQSNGTKVLLSIGGPSGNYGLNSEDDANAVALDLWNNYLGGLPASRPFGDAILDGVDFNIKTGPKIHYDVLARTLRSFDRNLVLAAAPGCAYPDSYLDAALDTGAFDNVWVEFFNSPSCQYISGNSRNLVTSWLRWTSSVKAKKVFLGLPASESAAKGGFIPSNVLAYQILPQVKASPKYGGVMLWNRYYDETQNFSAAIKPFAYNLLPKLNLDS